MTVDEAYEFFINVHYLYRKIKVLQEVGLGYITLGQSAVTLSGGEAQRVKLGTELSKRETGKTFYILMSRRRVCILKILVICWLY
jgi:excinuclease ABC subunit A